MAMADVRKRFVPSEQHRTPSEKKLHRVLDGYAQALTDLEAAEHAWGQLSDILDTWGFVWMEEREALPFRLRQARNQGQDDMQPKLEAAEQREQALREELARLSHLANPTTGEPNDT